jgi:carboxyl-terminal processing protease
MSWRRWVLSLSAVALLLPMGLLRGAEEEEEGDSKSPPAAVSKEDQYFEMMRIFADTFEQVERNYVKEVDRRKLIEAALRGMMDELDPYSSYIGPEDLARFNVQVEQEFGGIGIQVAPDPRTHRLTVVSPLPGTPAYKAGVRAGDTIMEINGKSTEKMSVDDAVKILKGKTGEEVTIGVLHPGGAKEQLKMQRAIIHVATVQGDSYKSDDSWNFMLDPEKKVGYVRLSGFARNSARELKDALTDLKAQGMKALVLDLRFNPGGLLNVATEVADLFLEDGKIVSTKGRNTEERTVYARKPGTFTGFPMAILVNRFSASASEIVSAALQDHKRAVVIGERTWGKGSVQNVIDLESGKSALKLTTASYHRPSGKNIHRFPDAKETDEWGVLPDENFMVPFSEDDMRKYIEYRRQRDVLSKEGPPKSDFTDKQLAKAIDYVTEQLSSDGKTEATAKADSAKPPIEKTPEKSPESKDGEKKGPPASDKDKKEPEKNDAEKKSESSARENWRWLRSLPQKLVEFPIKAA